MVFRFGRQRLLPKVQLSSTLSLFPFAQHYHRGSYTVAVTNGVGTTYSSSTVDVQAYGYNDGVSPFPEVVNCSVRGFTGGAEGIFTAGISLMPPLLSIGGSPFPVHTYASGTNHRLLVRGIGPGLAPFLGGQTIAGATELTLRAGSTHIASNDGAWLAIPNITETAAAAGAFPLTPGSRDSALLLSLDPGNYTAQLAAPAGDGTALIEFYVVGGLGNIRNLSARAFVSAIPRCGA